MVSQIRQRVSCRLSPCSNEWFIPIFEIIGNLFSHKYNAFVIFSVIDTVIYALIENVYSIHVKLFIKEHFFLFIFWKLVFDLYLLTCLILFAR